MFRTLYSKLALVSLVLFCFLGMIALVLTGYSTEMYQAEVNQKLNLDLAEHIANHADLIQQSQLNQEAVKEVFHMLMLVNPGIEIYLLDLDGNILAFSAPPEKVKLKKVDLKPIYRLTKGAANLPVLGDDPRSVGHKKIFSVTPIPNRDEPQGWLYVILGGEIYDSIAAKMKDSYILRFTTTWILVSVLVSIITGLLLFAFLTRRIRRLTRAMDAYGQYLTDDSAQPGPAPRHGGDDEIDRLQANFKQMTARIESQMDRIRRLDANRRELFINLSHDIRTPLAGLQGYIQTLLMKNDQLSADDKRKYLKIANRQCRRLGKLVKDLFELAKLEDDKMVIQRESFNLNELVQDIVQKFGLAAQTKKIRIIVNTPEELPFVNADIGLIERVLENLLENALRHTPRGGLIEVDLIPQQNDIMVKIQDSGSGIKKESLPFVFDRYHQQEQADSNSKGQSGLGLAITKRILALHGQSIRVESIPQKGTTFLFHLSVDFPEHSYQGSYSS